MRISRFWELVEGEFGRAYAAELTRSQHLTSLGGVTAHEALNAGTPPRQVWLALCQAMDVPEHRRFGADQPPRAGGRD